MSIHVDQRPEISITRYEAGSPSIDPTGRPDRRFHNGIPARMTCEVVLRFSIDERDCASLEARAEAAARTFQDHA